MIVKICGLTREKDVVACVSTGVPLLGFISIPRSKRFLPVEEIRELLEKVGTARKRFSAVLVLEPSSPAEALDKIRKSGADAVQLYSLSPSQIALLHGKGFLVFRTIAIPVGSPHLSAELVKQIKSFSKTCDGVFFDSSVAGKAGGTGKQIDFNLLEQAASVARRANKKITLFLSGGMDLQRLQGLSGNKKLLSLIDGVDASSGVEFSPGKKDLLKLTTFVSFARKL